MSKRVKTPEFRNWKFMNVSESGFWIYQNPENTEAAMVSPKTGEIIFIMDLATKQPIYTSPNAKKYAKEAQAFGRRLPI